MSEEERELLARIGQLAGQINRHKNHQTGSRSTVNQHPSQNRHNSYRHASAPYPTRSYRVGRPQAAHHHRTLQLNSGSSPVSRSASSGAETPPGWISKTDRHHQLINANVYEKDIQTRAKAMEETRQRKISDHRQREKTQFNDFLKHQAVVSNTPANQTGRNELVVQDIHFRVVDGGKKLVKVSGACMPKDHLTPQYISPNLDAPTASLRTPKSAVIAGVKFFRTKTGNLVANRIVNDQRQSGTVKKTNEACKIFSTTGSCPKGPRCRYIHDPNKVALCKEFLKDGKCASGEFCDLSHDMSPERTPNCLHFAKGHCAKADCPYTHSKAPPSAPVCRAFGFKGYCEKGANCTERHVFECPDFSNTGRCKIKGCKLLHRERASVLRNQAKADDESMGDISSDDEAGDSDDVDSDEVAEFIDADSDCSDFEDKKDFLSL